MGEIVDWVKGKWESSELCRLDSSLLKDLK